MQDSHCHTTCVSSCPSSSNSNSVSSSHTDDAKCYRGGICQVRIRMVLLVLGLVGTAVEFILRSSLSVAIVAMVNSTDTTTTTTQNHSHEGVCPAALDASTNTDSSESGVVYNWTLQQQGFVLGTFFWGYLFTKCVGGRIAEVVGGRITMGVTLGLCGVMSVLCPFAASLHPYALAAVRLVMGLLQGPSIPALYSVIVRWARQEELTVMVLVTYAGTGLGMVLGLGCTGYVVEALGWQWVFYGGGLIAFAWTPLWFLLVRDCPARHPFASAEEKRLLSGITIQPRKRVPWCRLARCPTIYILILAEFSFGWVLVLITVEAPTFLAIQIGMSSTTSSLVMMVAAGISTISCMFFGCLSDYLYRRELLSKLAIRRLVYSIAMVMTVGCCVGMVLAGCNQVWVSVLCFLLGFAVPSQAAAYQMTPMDIAPNYSGTIIGLIGLGQLGSFLAPIINSYLIPLVRHFLIKKNGWSLVFLVAAVVYLVVGVVYVCGVTDEEQEWNMYVEVDEDDTEEKE